MKKNHNKLNMSESRKILTLLISLAIISGTVSASNAGKVPVIINFKDAVYDYDIQMVKDMGGEIKYVYTIIPGIAASIPANRLGELKRYFRVSGVDDDLEVVAMEINTDNKINATPVWNAGFTGQGVRVAILDTGIAQNHPEFTGRIVFCESEVSAICEDGNGHGTHVAGIAGAAGNLETPNSNRAKGVAPTISFMIYKVLDDSGSGTLAGLIAGIQNATIGPDGTLGTLDDADVISMSLGFNINFRTTNCDDTIPSLTGAINTAVNNDTTVVAAAGNSGRAGVSPPGCISKTIAVGATDFNDNLARFSGQGFAMQDHGVVAPGVSIFSTLPGGYGTLSGTSMATPAVTGAVALLKSANSSLTPAEMKTKLFSTAKDLGVQGPDTKFGNGRIDVYRAYICATGGACIRP